jgi:hypothetical protein
LADGRVGSIRPAQNGDGGFALGGGEGGVIDTSLHSIGQSRRLSLRDLWWEKLKTALTRIYTMSTLLCTASLISRYLSAKRRVQWDETRCFFQRAIRLKAS